jgi:hypothetical protein
MLYNMRVLWALLYFVESSDGGEAGIRTLGGDKPSTVFKTAAFDRSATSPIAA